MSSVGLLHLRSFAAVADAGSITEASRVLYVAQPALSRQLAALEREIGQRLLDRTARGAVLTDDGRRFLAGTQRILAAYDGLIGQGAAEPVVAPDGRALLRLGVEADAPPQLGESLRAYGRSWRGSLADHLRARAGPADDAPRRARRRSRALAAVAAPVAAHGGSHTRGLLRRAAAEYAAAHPDGVPASVFVGRPFAIWDRSEAALEHDYWVGLVERVAGGPSTS